MDSSGFLSDEEDSDAAESLSKWPLEYVQETKAYACGWCGHAFMPNPTADDLQTHFKSCENPEKETDALKSAVMKEVKTFHMNMKTEFDNEILSLKTAIKTELETLKKSGDNETGAVDVLFNRVKDLEEKVKENDGTIQALKRQLENEGDEPSARRQRFHVEPTPSEPLSTIPMNSFNLFTKNHLFRPSYKWIIDGIKLTMEQRVFQQTSNMFQWDGHHVQARAKLQLKPDDCVYVSLSLKDNYQHRDVTLFPQVYYLLKGGGKNSANVKHKIKCTSYMIGSPFKSSLDFESRFIHKKWLDHSFYNVDDAVELEIYVEPPSMIAGHVFSYDGTLKWKVDNFKQRFQLEKDALIAYQESVYFYTAEKGYRVQVRLHLNGIRGTGLGARIMFLTGKFDADLPMAYPHSTTVTLANNKEPEKRIVKIVREDIQNHKYYDVEICTFEEMQSLVEDDALLCNVKIQPQ